MTHNSQKRIGFDMDDVICDTHGQLLRWAETTYGISAANNHDQPIRTLLNDAQIKQMTDMLNEGSFFGTLSALPGAVETLQSLNENFDLFIVTAAMEHPACMPHKFQWITEVLPFLDPLKIVFCGEKYVADVDYLVDDTPRHFEHLRGEGIVYSAPKNREETRYKRVNNWEEVRELFGSLSS